MKDFSTAISFIASHFYMVDIDEFLKASREIQYKIISHEDLQIESEDSLFDIISQIIEIHKDTDEVEDILFFEQIEFLSLSETKFLEFVSVFDFNDMSGQLWQNLCQCFFPHRVKKCQRKQKRHRQQNEKKKRECSLESIIVAGYDEYNGLGEKPSNQSEDGNPIIFPPVKLSFDPSSLLSYSAYCEHSVVVTSDGSLKGVGDNRDGQISATLQKTVIDDFTDFCIKDGSGRQLAAVSAVCYAWGTLYMFSKSTGNERQLVLCDCEINEGDPVFLDIGNHHPVSLFSGFYHSAAIGSEGEVIIINRNSVKNSPNSPIAYVSLPEGEKASSVACCDDSVVVLSSNGRVFTSPHRIWKQRPQLFYCFRTFRPRNCLCVRQIRPLPSCQQGRSRLWTWIK